MKRILSLLMFVGILGIWSMQAQTTVFSATFDDIAGTGGTDGGWSGSVANTALDSYGETGAEWTLTKAFKGNNCLKAGTGSLQGIIQTPALSNLSGDAVLTFNAGAWNGTSEQTELLLEITGGGSLNVSSVTLTKGEFTLHTVNIIGGNSSSKITFKGKQASNSRFFLDEITVTSDGGTPSQSTDATLKSLKVGEKEILTSGTFIYTHVLPEGTTELPTITPEKNHDKATLGTPTLPTIAGILDGSNNQYSITVTAEDGTTKTYIITFSIHTLPQGVIFEETCGEEGPSSNPRATPADYTDWDNASTVSYSGNADIRSTSTLNSHVWFAAYNPESPTSVSPRNLIISGINTSGYGSLILSYDVASNAADGANANLLFVEAYDVVAGTKDTLDVPSTILATQNAYSTINNLSIPSTSNLILTFWTDESNASGYRLDNIRIAAGEVSKDPTINIQPTYVDFGGVDLDETSTKEAVVEGLYLTENISYSLAGDDKDAFSITTEGWNDLTGGKVIIKFTPTEVRAYSAYIEVKSTGAADNAIYLAGTGLTPAVGPEDIIASFNGYTPNEPPSNGIFLATGGNVANKGIATLTRDAAGSNYAVNTDNIAASQGWADANTTEKYWIATFSTKDAKNLKLTSKQKGSNTGPRDFKVQYKVGEGNWTDLSGATITVANDNYVAGVLDMDLPAAMENQESVSLRWLCTSTVRIAGDDPVASGGVNRLDVVISTTSGSNMGNVDQEAVYAYVDNNTLIVKNAPANAIVTVYNITGKMVAQTTATEVQLPAKGIYIVKIGSKAVKVVNR